MKTEILINLIRAIDETTKIQAEYVGILEEMRSQKLFLLHLIEKARLPEEVYVPKVVDPDFAYLKNVQRQCIKDLENIIAMWSSSQSELKKLIADYTAKCKHTDDFITRAADKEAEARLQEINQQKEEFLSGCRNRVEFAEEKYKVAIHNRDKLIGVLAVLLICCVMIVLRN